MQLSGSSLWVGIRNPSSRGDFHKAFLLAWGSAPHTVQAIVDGMAGRQHGGGGRDGWRAGAVMKTQRAGNLRPYAPELVSEAYRRASELDFSDLPNDVSIEEVLRTIRQSFDHDGFATHGVNLASLSEYFLRLVDEVANEDMVNEADAAMHDREEPTSHVGGRGGGRKGGKKARRKHKKKTMNSSDKERRAGDWREQTPNTRHCLKVTCIEMLLSACDFCEAPTEHRDLVQAAEAMMSFAEIHPLSSLCIFPEHVQRNVATVNKLPEQAQVGVSCGTSAAASLEPDCALPTELVTGPRTKHDQDEHDDDCHASHQFGAGSSVQVHGLIGAAHLNSKVGTVQKFLPSKRRWMVQLLGAERPIAIKPENLTLVEPCVYLEPEPEEPPELALRSNMDDGLPRETLADGLSSMVRTPSSQCGRNPNPLVGAWSKGHTPQNALRMINHRKVCESGKYKCRMIKPGRLTPEIEGGDPFCPDQGLIMPKQPNGRCRHIASYSLDELREIGWCGAKYLSNEGKHEATGNWVPFVKGYDSDEDRAYEPIDTRAATQAGTLGLAADEVGQWISREGEPGVEPTYCQIQHPGGAPLPHNLS